MATVLRILIFLVLSGVIAYVGDYVGHRAGKMKISFMGFRPRKTSRVIAVLTGVLITVITLALFASFSQQAWIALFELENIEAEISDLQDKKAELDKEIDSLEEEIEKLKKEQNTLRNITNKISHRVSLYPVVFEAYEPLAYGLIKKDSSEETVRRELDVLKDRVSQELYNKNMDLIPAVLARGIDVTDSQPKVVFVNSGFKPEYNQEFLDYYLINKEFDQVVGMYAAANAFLGDDLPVEFFSVEENKVMFFKGQAIVEDTVDATLPREDIWEFMIKLLLSDVREKALEKGMLPDPKAGLGVDIPNPEVWDLCDRIMQYSSSVTVRIVATEDIYTLGPLKFEIEIVPEK